MKGNKNSKYEFPAIEKHLYHVAIQPGGFDPATGKPLAAAYTQKLSAAEMKQSEESRSFAGKKVEILHDPTVSKEEKEKGSTNGVVNAETAFQAARVKYKALTGEDADPSWGEVKLSFEIQAAEQVRINEEVEEQNRLTIKKEGDALSAPENVPATTTGATDVPNNPVAAAAASTPPVVSPRVVGKVTPPAK